MDFEQISPRAMKQPAAIHYRSAKLCNQCSWQGCRKKYIQLRHQEELEIRSNQLQLQKGVRTVRWNCWTPEMEATETTNRSTIHGRYKLNLLNKIVKIGVGFKSGTYKSNIYRARVPITTDKTWFFTFLNSLNIIINSF